MDPKTVEYSSCTLFSRSEFFMLLHPFFSCDGLEFDPATNTSPHPTKRTKMNRAARVSTHRGRALGYGSYTFLLSSQGSQMSGYFSETVASGNCEYFPNYIQKKKVIKSVLLEKTLYLEGKCVCSGNAIAAKYMWTQH